MAKILSKRNIFFVLFLAIVMLGVFFYENQEARQGLFNKLKAKLAPELNLSEDTGLNLSEISAENFISRAREEQKELSSLSKSSLSKQLESLAEPSAAKEEKEELSSLSLEQIKEKLDEIKAKKQEIEKEINKLIALQEIEQKIDEIAKQAEILSQQVKTLGFVY